MKDLKAKSMIIDCLYKAVLDRNTNAICIVLASFF